MCRVGGIRIRQVGIRLDSETLIRQHSASGAVGSLGGDRTSYKRGPASAAGSCAAFCLLSILYDSILQKASTFFHRPEIAENHGKMPYSVGCSQIVAFDALITVRGQKPWIVYVCTVAVESSPQKAGWSFLPVSRWFEHCCGAGMARAGMPKLRLVSRWFEYCCGAEMAQ